MTGPPPLTGIRVVELAGLAPGPFAGLMLADNGASVLRIDRASPIEMKSASPKTPPLTADTLTRRKAAIAVDLKNPSGKALVKELISHVDVLIDPFRPGVLEKLGLGPEVLLSINPKLIVGRMTGFRRDGRYKDMAGHDINYIAVSGALSMLGGRGKKPLPPMNILGDFAGGGAILFQGILLALLQREKTSLGQTVEANMVDGSAYLATAPRLGTKTSLFDHPRGDNMLDGGSPWYDTYETRDGKFVAVGALEPQFFALLLKGLGLEGRGIERTRHERKTWPELRRLFKKLFREKSRSEWEQVFDGTDACVTPVLEMGELEIDPEREGDQRPAVTLRDTPSLAIQSRSITGDPSKGQGQGVPGNGWTPIPLRPGDAGEQLLSEWLGWRRGKDFEIDNGAVVKRQMSKL